MRVKNIIVCVIIVALTCVGCTQSDPSEVQSNQDNMFNGEDIWAQELEETDVMKEMRISIETVINSDEIKEIAVERVQGGGRAQYSVTDVESVSQVKEWLEKLSLLPVDDPGVVYGNAVTKMTFKVGADEEIVLRVRNDGAAGAYLVYQAEETEEMHYFSIENWEQNKMEFGDIMQNAQNKLG